MSFKDEQYFRDDSNLTGTPSEEEPSDFFRDLTKLINKYGMDNTYNTPDYILANHLMFSMQNLNGTLVAVRKWFNYPTLSEKLSSDTTEATEVSNDSE